MSARIIQVDSFTNRPFAGNPAAVCLLDGPAPDRWMQDVAAEMNLSETAFVSPFQPAGVGVYKLRWFTPNVEVDLCGHATLATAHVLWEEGMVAVEKPALFETRSGRLTATRRGDWIELDFPAEPLNVAIDDPGELDSIASAVNSPVVSAGRNRFDLLVELADEQAVRNLRPDIRRVASFPVRGRDRDEPWSVRRGSISSPASSRPRSASTKTRSAARRTAAWAPSGPRSWAATSSPATRSRGAAESSRFASKAPASRSSARRSR